VVDHKPIRQTVLMRSQVKALVVYLLHKVQFRFRFHH